VSKLIRNHDSEKESMKRDYENLLANVREEYKNCTGEMRGILESKNDEIQELSFKIKDMEGVLRKERVEIEETLHKDSYQVDILSRENEALRSAKNDFESERESLYNEIRNQENEVDRWFSENKELKKKVKKLEQILYGKKDRK
jgi:chromosome segregation ATPase